MLTSQSCPLCICQCIASRWLMSLNKGPHYNYYGLRGSRLMARTAYSKPVQLFWRNSQNIRF